MFARLWGLIKKEFLAIWRDPKSRIILLVPPLIQFVIFANILTMEIKNTDVMTLDFANTLESRELISAFKHSTWFNTVKPAQNMHQIAAQIKNHKIDMAIIIPDDFTSNIKKGQPTQVQVILDGRTTSTATALNGYANQIINRFNEKLLPQSTGADIQIINRTWFNPNAVYQWYLVIALIEMLALVVTLILTALSVAREKELGTFEQLIVSPYTAFEILLGKTIPPICFVMGLVTIMSEAAVFFFGIPFTGSFLLFLVSCFIALLSFVGIGLFISSICQNQQQALLGAFSFMMPAILISGFISPIEDMPQLLQYITYADPVRFFLNIAKGIFLKEMPFIDILRNMIPLIIIATITLFLAGRTFKRNLE